MDLKVPLPVGTETKEQSMQLFVSSLWLPLDRSEGHKS